MNPFEKIALGFLKKELTNNPGLIGKFVQHILDQQRVDPNVSGPVVQLVTDLIPFLVSEIPS